MKAQKFVSTFARSDLSEASKWYEKQQKGLGKRFLNEMKAAFEIICKNPTGFQIRYLCGHQYHILYPQIAESA